MGSGLSDQRRICYVNSASHLLNAYNPNMFYPDLAHRWSDGAWFRFIDMIVDFGFNVFEFWLEPKLFCREGLQAPFGLEFTRQMNAVIDYALSKGLETEMLCSLATVGGDWHTLCPRQPDDWTEILHLWDRWTARFPGVRIVGIFPGDPGACSRNGCTAETYIDGALAVAQVIGRNLPLAQIELGTWGPPFFGWGIIEGPAGWQGEFVQECQHSAWRFDKQRADRSMAYLLKRLPEFPADTAVAINLGFNPDGNPVDDQDARPWAQEIARTHRILTWDFSLTEGENAIYPHYRFERLFRRRREEHEAAPYSGGICFTMTPLLNQLSLYEAAQSFVTPEASPAQLAERFFRRLFGPRGTEIVPYLPLFEIVPDWGHYGQLEISRQTLHTRMTEAADLLRTLAGQEDDTVPFHPSPAAYQAELLFFAQLFAELSGPAPDYIALRRRYWEQVYSIYDRLPIHVDMRPVQATDRLIERFRHL